MPYYFQKCCFGSEKKGVENECDRSHVFLIEIMILRNIIIKEMIKLSIV